MKASFISLAIDYDLYINGLEEQFITTQDLWPVKRAFRQEWFLHQGWTNVTERGRVTRRSFNIFPVFIVMLFTVCLLFVFLHPRWCPYSKKPVREPAASLIYFNVVLFRAMECSTSGGEKIQCTRCTFEQPLNFHECDY